MELKDCKHDEVYYWESNFGDLGENGYINKFQIFPNRVNIAYYISAKNHDAEMFYREKNQNNPVNIRLASLEEIHWLEECNLLDKFIPYEEAILSFNGIQIINNKITPKLVKIWNKLLNKKNYYEKE